MGADVDGSGGKMQPGRFIRGDGAGGRGGGEEEGGRGRKMRRWAETCCLLFGARGWCYFLFLHLWVVVVGHVIMDTFVRLFLVQNKCLPRETIKSIYAPFLVSQLINPASPLPGSCFDPFPT